MEPTIESAAAFAPALPPGGLYVGTALRQRVDLIEHLLEFGHQMILLCGAPASGKTTLLGSLAADAGSRWQCVDVRGGAALSGRALLETIAQAVGVGLEPGDDDASILERLRQRAAQTERAGRLLVVLLDDADQLSPDALSTLMALARHDDAGAEPRVLMTADHDHAALLASLQRDEPSRALVHVIEIPPLNEAQVEAFLSQRARALGLELEDCLDAEALATIVAEGEGNPGKVLALARQSVGGQLLPRKTASTGNVLSRLGALGDLAGRRSLLVGVGVLGAAVLGAFLWLGRPANNLPTPEAAEGVGEASTGAARPDSGARQQMEISLSATSDASVPQAGQSTEAPATVVPQDEAHGVAVPESPTQATVAPAAPTSADTAAQTPAADANGLPPTPASTAGTPPAPSAGPAMQEAAPAATATALAAGAGTAAATRPTPAPAAARQSAPPRQEKTTPRQPVPSPAKTAATEKPAAKAKAAAGEAPTKRTPAATPAKPERSSKAAASAQAKANGPTDLPAAGYTLQLIGVKERAAANEFIRKHQLAKGARIIESRRNGQPWFTVAYGSYATRAAATAGIEALPASVRRATTPWVRALNGRQKSKK